MKCPACGNRGPRKHEDDHFEVRGQVDGVPIRKCRQCGIGLAVGAFGRARMIPEQVWVKMEKEWARSFPTDNPDMAIQAGLEDVAGGTMDYASLFTKEAVDAICRDGSDAELNSTERTLRLHAEHTPHCAELLAALRAEQDRRGLEPWPANYRHQDEQGSAV